jgi:hypothetical protein
MLRVGVSAPDIAGADESNPPAPESFRSTVAYFASASGQNKRPQRRALRPKFPGGVSQNPPRSRYFF